MVDPSHFRTTAILEILRKYPGSNLEHDMGRYRFKNADGGPVIDGATGMEYPEPTHQMVDELVNQGRIVLERSKYRLS